MHMCTPEKTVRAEFVRAYVAGVVGVIGAQYVRVCVCVGNFSTRAHTNTPSLTNPHMCTY